MHRVRFEYEVVTVLRLTAAEVETLGRLCAAHYDGAVNALGEPGRNGILHGARNRIAFGPSAEERAACDVEVTYRQLDTLCKATETVESAGAHLDLTRLLSEACAESRRLNGGR